MPKLPLGLKEGGKNCTKKRNGQRPARPPPEPSDRAQCGPSRKEVALGKSALPVPSKPDPQVSRPDQSTGGQLPNQGRARPKEYSQGCARRKMLAARARPTLTAHKSQKQQHARDPPGDLNAPALLPGPDLSKPTIRRASPPYASMVRRQASNSEPVRFFKPPEVPRQKNAASDWSSAPLKEKKKPPNPPLKKKKKKKKNPPPHVRQQKSR